MKKEVAVFDAVTLGELKKLIDLAIDEYGEDADWNGWDDGCLFIGQDSDKDYMRIYPKD